MFELFRHHGWNEIHHGDEFPDLRHRRGLAVRDRFDAHQERVDSGPDAFVGHGPVCGRLSSILRLRHSERP